MHLTKMHTLPDLRPVLTKTDLFYVIIVRNHHSIKLITPPRWQQFIIIFGLLNVSSLHHVVQVGQSGTRYLACKRGKEHFLIPELVRILYIPCLKAKGGGRGWSL